MTSPRTPGTAGEPTTEGERCGICLEEMTNSSGHRLACLRCGHLYGKDCIERWIKQNLPARNNKCPQCQATAKLKDIRCIYSTNLIVIDTEQLDQANRKVEERDKTIGELKGDNELLKRRLEFKDVEVEALRSSLWREKERNNYISSLNNKQRPAPGSLVKRAKVEHGSLPFAHIRDVELNPGGGCRLVAYCNFVDSLIVTQPSHRHYIKGFGVRKVDVHNLVPNDLLVLHEKKIKDMKISQHQGTLLSCSFDKTIKLTDLTSETTFLSHSMSIEPWCVEFNPLNQHEFFVGTRNGAIYTFDSRIANRHLESLQRHSSNPVVALNYVDLKKHKSKLFRGLFCSYLDSCSFFERVDNAEDGNFRSMPVLEDKGKYTSAHFDHESGYCLLSCRPSSHHSRNTHLLIDFPATFANRSQVPLQPEIVNRFQGGQKANRKPKAKLFSLPGRQNSVLVCAGDESISGAFVWDAASGKCLQKLSTDENDSFLDVCWLQNSPNVLLSALDDKGLRVYKCQG